MVIFRVLRWRGSHTYKLRNLAGKIRKNMKFWAPKPQKSWKNPKFQVPKLQSEIRPCSAPTPPHFFSDSNRQFYKLSFALCLHTPLRCLFFLLALMRGWSKTTIFRENYEIWPLPNFFSTYECKYELRFVFPHFCL